MSWMWPPQKETEVSAAEAGVFLHGALGGKVRADAPSDGYWV